LKVSRPNQRQDVRASFRPLGVSKLREKNKNAKERRDWQLRRQKRRGRTIDKAHVNLRNESSTATGKRRKKERRYTAKDFSNLIYEAEDTTYTCSNREKNCANSKARPAPLGEQSKICDPHLSLREKNGPLRGLFSSRISSLF